MLKFAIYVSDHGFGHAARVCALAEEFINFGIYCHIITQRPAFLFKSLNSQFNTLHFRAIDTGVKHAENLVSDLNATRKALLENIGNRSLSCETEVQFLRENKIDLIISDVAYLAADFATYASIPLFAVSNFDWYYIYADLFAQDETLKPVLNLIWSLYHRFDACFGLPFSTEQSLTAFSKVIPCGLLARKKKTYLDLRKILGWAKDSRILLVMFGGEGELQLDYEALCQAHQGIVISTQTGVQARNHIRVEQDADFLDLIYNADVVLCKPGYSTLAEAVQFGKPIVYCPRQNYPEETALIAGLNNYPGAIELPSLNLTRSAWTKVFSQVDRLTTLTPIPNNNSVVAGKIINKFLALSYSPSDLRSILDLGSNNLNYLLYDLKSQSAIHKAHLTTKLGKGFKGKSLSAYRLQKAKEIISPLLDIEREIGSQKIMLATGVSRLADNSHLIANWITKSYGIEYKLVSEELEIKYVEWTARQKRSGEEAWAVDIGGASTELVELKKRKPTGLSLPIGLLSLYNEVQNDHQKTLEYLDRVFKPITLERASELIGVGLTFTYLAAVYFAKKVSDPDVFDGMRLQKSKLSKILTDLIKQDTMSYLPFLISPQYLPILQLSLTYTIYLLDRFQVSEIIVCSDGITTGYARLIDNKSRHNK